MEKNYNILFKYASRSRPAKFFIGLDNILANLSNKENYCILISLDSDDTSMYNKVILERLKEYLVSYGDKIIIQFGTSKNKIDAINRDVNEIKERFNFDILVNFSDDMAFTKFGFDDIIRNKFSIHFVDTNGNLHFNDGYAGDKISTMSIIGRVYYEGFNYIYHPSYVSLWCDNEYTLIAQKNNKIQYFEEQIFVHNHPSNIGGFVDEQLKNTESFSEVDYNNFINRQKNQFQ